MSMEAEELRQLQEENQRLRAQNEILWETVRQLNETVNRMLNRYVTSQADA